MSGSIDKTLRIWNLSSYQCNTIIINVFCCYQNSLLEIQNNRIVIGEWKALTILNLNTYVIEHKIKNEEIQSIYSLNILRDGNLLFGNDKGIIHIYDIKKNDIVQKLRAHDKLISNLLIVNKEQFISCSFDKTIKVWQY